MTDFMRVIADESDRFLRAIYRADTETAVPTCPGWSADGLFRPQGMQ